MMMSPPLPPSPPDGPPRGTNFSRRKAMQPLPPSPAFTRILASSINMAYLLSLSESSRAPSVPNHHGEAASRILGISTLALGACSSVFCAPEFLSSHRKRNAMSDSAPHFENNATLDNP